jgi:hypothetical protein
VLGGFSGQIRKDYGYVVDIVDDIEYFDEHAERRRKIYQTEPRWRIHDE